MISSLYKLLFSRKDEREHALSIVLLISEHTIHSKIVNLVKKYLTESSSEFLFRELTYEQYRYAFHNELERLGLPDHTPHDCRVRFVTAAKSSGMDEYAIKRIVGHVIGDLTERVYTKRDFGWLKSEMQKLR